MTLDQGDLRAVTTAAASTAFDRDRLWLNGSEVEDAKTSKRFRACVDGIRSLATDRVDPTGKVLVSKEDWVNMPVQIASYNTFPTAAGLASSAAGYAALVASLVELFGAKESYPHEFTAIARQGSGSACRSLYGGFVAWRAGSEDDQWKNSIAEQVADEDHWKEMRAIIMVVSDAKKETSSTAGMSTSVATSDLLQFRAQAVVSKRMESIQHAIINKDFDTFGKITMMDSNQFHACCLDTYPPIFYMNDVSKNIVQIITRYNEWAGTIRAAYTFDAGPNAVIYTLEKYQLELLALLLKYFPPQDSGTNEYVSNENLAQKALDVQLDPSLIDAVEKSSSVYKHGDVKMMYCTRAGEGAKRLDPTESVFAFKYE